MFFVTWYHSIANLMSSDHWAFMAVASLGMAIVLALVYLFASPLWMRKVGFFGGLLMLVLFLVGNIFAWQQKRSLENRDGAIVMSASVQVKGTPKEEGTTRFVLHEGTHVMVTDTSVKDWTEVSLPDGREGWVKASDIEII